VRAPSALAPMTISSSMTPAPPISSYPPGYGPPPGTLINAPSAGTPDPALQLALAPWWKRLVAIIIDWAVLGAGYFVLLAVIGILVKGSQNGTTTNMNQNQSGSLALGFFILIILASFPNAIYFGLMNGSKRGQTVGKMAMGIAVRDARTGQRIRFWRAVGRSLISGVVFQLFAEIPFILDSLAPLRDKRRQSWHDKVAGTIVVDLRP
jgi:uncharacterized RDD family membrane protein YckC